MSNRDLLVQRYASEIVQEVMMLVIMRENPTTITDGVAAKLQVMLGEMTSENS